MLDALLRLSDAQVITASAASTNVYDSGSARDIGAGNRISVQAMVNTVFATGTSLQVALQESTDNSTFYDVDLGPAVVTANLLAGLFIYRRILPPRTPNMFSGTQLVPARYYRLYYTVAGSDFTTGKIDAWLAEAGDMQATNNYARNYVTA